MLPTQVPVLQTADRVVNQLQRNIIPVLNQVVQNPLVSGNLIQSVSLAAGSNTISHGLASLLTGWFCTRVRASTQIYDNQDNNPNPSKTLILISSAAVVVDLYVF